MFPGASTARPVTARAPMPSVPPIREENSNALPVELIFATNDPPWFTLGSTGFTAWKKPLLLPATDRFPCVSSWMAVTKEAGSTNVDQTRAVPVGFNLATNAQLYGKVLGLQTFWMAPEVMGNVGECV